jgi:hypothetical protein
MQMNKLWLAVPVVCLCAWSQEAPSRIIGEVTGRTAEGISVLSDQGATVTVKTAGNTVYLRVPPGEKDLKKAARITADEIGTGDRVLARGQLSGDKQSIAANTLVVISKADLARKQQSDLEEWRRRGAAGRIASVDAANHQFTMTMLSRQGSQSLVVDASGNPDVRRYAPDSARFADARPGTLAELQPGDQVRVLGQREGDRIKAERIVSGAFRNIAGTVIAVDAGKGELRVRDLDSKKPVDVRIDSEAMLRRLPPMAAAMLARRFNPGAAPERPAGNMRPEGARPPGAGGGGGDLHAMLERMPPLALNELKPGDAVLLSTTKGSDPASATALTLLAGVEPLLTTPGAANRLGGMWNFGDIVLPQ